MLSYNDPTNGAGTLSAMSMSESRAAMRRMYGRRGPPCTNAHAIPDKQTATTPLTTGYWNNHKGIYTGVLGHYGRLRLH